MAIAVPLPGQDISAVAFGAPVANQLNGLGLDTAWIAYVPTIPNGSIAGSNGVNKARYKAIGKTIVAQYKYSFGASGGGATGGTGSMKWSVPIAFSALVDDYTVLGAAHMVTANGATRWIATPMRVGAYIELWGTFGQLTSTQPSAVTYLDGYYFSATYESV